MSSPGATAPVRMVTSAGLPVRFTFAITFPVFTGCCDTTASPFNWSDVASEIMLTPSFAATRGARSFPCAEALKTATR